MTAIGFARHDHGRCIGSAMRAAEALCARKRVQFTPVRRRVLEILLEEHRALGAYEILAVLSRDGMGSQPPVVYRALDFLVGHGLAHRIERLNAWAACTHPGGAHVPLFLVCRDCRAVAEAETTPDQGRLGLAAAEAGFVIERVAVEAEGLCPACAATEKGETEGDE